MEIGLREALLQRFFVQSMGFAEIGERFGVISQFGVHETY